MILKNLTRKASERGSVEQIIRYCTRYSVGKGKHPKEHAAKVLLRHNLATKDVAGWIKEFKAIDKSRTFKSRNRVIVHHCIASFNEKDTPHITDTMLADIAKRLVTLRAPTSLCLITVHRDTASVHLHAIFSGTLLNAKAHRLSKADFEKLKISLQEYHKQKYKTIQHSFPRHGDRRDKTRKVPHTKGRPSHKHHLTKAIQAIYDASNTQQDFIQRSTKEGYAIYRRGKEQVPTGLLYKDRKYRFKTLGISLERLSVKETKVIKNLVELRAIRERVNARNRLNEKDDLILEKERRTGARSYGG